MKKFFLSLIAVVLLTTITFAQNVPSNSFAQSPKLLDRLEIDKLFPESVLKNLALEFPVYKVYKFSDITGSYYCILSESREEVNSSNDTFNYKIKAVTLKLENELFTKIWEINDQIIRNKEESSIWFWTIYIDFKDYDKDGILETVIVYGTNGLNGYDDGRIKFIIYNKGQKVAIRHQNGLLDGERSTQIDQGFYSLPLQLQNSIKEKMKLMEQNNNAVFTGGWELAMKNKKLIIKD